MSFVYFQKFESKMGQYYRCSICGEEEKEFLPSCGCMRKISEKVNKKRAGAKLIDSFVSYNGFPILCESLEKDGNFFFVSMDITSPYEGLWSEIDENVFEEEREKYLGFMKELEEELEELEYEEDLKRIRKEEERKLDKEKFIEKTEKEQRKLDFLYSIDIL